MSPGESWTATVSVRTADPDLATWVERALGPETSREVPRARTRLRRPSGDTVELEISARDAGAMRAALNTYLGWVDLSLATARVSGRTQGSGKLVP